MENTQVLAKIADLIRLSNWKMVFAAQSGHFGGGASMAEILSVLYFGEFLNYRPREPKWPLRDIVITEGHLSAAFYSVLRLAGYDISEKEMAAWRSIVGAKLQGHIEDGVSGVEYTAGPLGKTLSYGVGEAWYAKQKGTPRRVFVIMGDGDNQEGQYKEAAVHAARLGLQNLVVIYNYNGKQIEGSVSRVDATDPVALWTAYGFHCILVENGHDVAALCKAFEEALAQGDSRPKIIIAQTIKGYGVTCASSKKDGMHGSVPTPDEYAQGIMELNVNLAGFNETAFIDWRVDRPMPGHNSPRPIRVVASKVASVCEDRSSTYKVGSKIATRIAFGRALVEHAELDTHIIAMSADLTKSVGMGDIERLFPDRFVPIGVTEAHMAGFAMGIAKDGKAIAVTGTFEAFLWEMSAQLRLAAMMRVPVICAFTHSGIGVGEDGATHHSLMAPIFYRDLPNAHCFEPCDANETVEVVAEAMRLACIGDYGPIFLRLTRQDVPVINRGHAPDAASGAYVARESDDGSPRVIVVASGALLVNAVLARDELGDVPVRVINVTSLSRFAGGRCATSTMFDNGVPVVTFHDATPECLGDAVLRELNRLGIHAPVHTYGVEGFGPGSGRLEDLYCAQRFDVNAIICRVREFLV
ncbi:MAG: hypothetical protein AAB444_00105 [Patescibacteria group bacterium]